MNGSFTEIATGTLDGMLFEKQYDSFVESLIENKKWFAYEFAKGDFKFIEISTADVREKLIQCRIEVRDRKRHNTFPFTYVKKNPDPKYIKIYDPMKCGSSCSLTAPDPWWIFSTILPEKEELLQLFPPKVEKKSFFKSLTL